MLHNMVVSLWRTAVPYVTSFVVVQAARLGIDLDSATVVGVLTVAGGLAYQAVGRWLEERVSPKWGWLLGWPEAPKYAAVSDAGKDGRSEGAV